MKELQLSRLVDMESPQSVLDEVRVIVLVMFPEFDFDSIEHVFRDVVRLFRGEYQGYRRCTTEYHDLKHTTDAFLAMARLMHGVVIGGRNLSSEQVNVGLVCALMHDTGYIQALEDDVGTGAKYTRIDTRRSIGFMDKYIAGSGLPREHFEDYPDILRCTGLDTRVSEMRFKSQETELLGKMLGTADLLGQMADRTYLEKLLFLFYEFREGGIRGYDTEVDLLKKTMDFYAMTQRRFASELDGLNEYVRCHFKVYWNLDRDLYTEAIENQMNYLTFILENHEKDYRDHLRRGGIVIKLKEAEARVESEIRTIEPVTELDAQVWFEKGILLSKSQHYERAIEAFTKALEMNPHFAKAYYGRGYAWAGKGDHDRAIADCTKALEIDPRFAKAYSVRGLSYANKRLYDRAIADFTKALEIDPRFAKAYYGRGYAWAGKGDHDRAIADCTKALEMNPRFAKAYYGRGYAWAGKGDLWQALADLKKALRLMPNDKRLQASVGKLVAEIRGKRAGKK